MFCQVFRSASYRHTLSAITNKEMHLHESMSGFCLEFLVKALLVAPMVDKQWVDTFNKHKLNLVDIS